MSAKSVLLTATGLASVLASLGASSSDVKAASDALADIEIGKAAETLKPGEKVIDRWEEGEMHKVPSGETLKVGPVEHSSGGGAEKMIRDYSKPAPQHGVELEAERLGAVLGPFKAYMRSMGTAVEKLAAGQETLTGVITAMLTKATEEEAGGLPGEAGHYAAFHAGKAQECLRAMKSLLGKASNLRDSLDDLEGDAKKACKAQIRDLGKQAARLGRDALANSYAAKSEDADPASEVRKSLHDMMEANAVLKADISAFHEKDKEKDEEKKAKKAAKKAAAKAIKKAGKKAAEKAAKAAAATAAAGTGEGAGTGGEKAAAAGETVKEAAKTVDPDALTKALQGQGVLEGTVKQILEIVSGRPVTSNVGPIELLKAETGGTALMTINNRIEEAVANDRLSHAGELRATDLLQKITAVQSGAMSDDMWKSMLAQSPVEVQEIFRVAA